MTDYVFGAFVIASPLSAVVMAAAAERARRQQAEDKIREPGALLDLAQAAILVRELEERTLYWNKSAEGLYGWTAEEAIGKDTFELSYQSESPPLNQAPQQV